MSRRPLVTLDSFVVGTKLAIVFIDLGSRSRLRRSGLSCSFPEKITLRRRVMQRRRSAVSHGLASRRNEGKPLFLGGLCAVDTELHNSLNIRKPLLQQSVGSYSTRAAYVRVDRSLLRLAPGCLEKRARSRLAAAKPLASAEMQYLGRQLRALTASEWGPLIDVAAAYSVWTLRSPHLNDQLTLLYPTFLLAGWVWDDLVDTTKATPEAPRVVEWGWRRLAHAAIPTEFAFEPPPTVSNGAACAMIQRVESCAELVVRVRTLTSEHVQPYAKPIEHESVRFFRSFAQKLQFTHENSKSRAGYEATRAICVGLFPSFAISNACKAHVSGVAASEVQGFTELAPAIRCAELATLHCAVVNDLFSLFKDRRLEDTANYASVLAPSASLHGYFVGSTRALDYARELYSQFEESLQLLPKSPVRDLVEETWRHMMEGNILFHLMVPRYREGVLLVRALLARSFTESRKRHIFNTILEH